jgi:hypothetical protein
MMKLLAAKKLWTAPILCILMLLFISSSVWGQAGVTNSEIDAFARIQIQFAEIAQKYEDQLSETSNPEEQHNIIEKFNEEMVHIVESEGLSLERYEEIAEELSENSELLERLMRAMEDLQ